MQVPAQRDPEGLAATCARGKPREARVRAHAHVCSTAGPADARPGAPVCSVATMTALTLNIGVTHQMLLQTVQDFLNVAAGHTAVVHSLRSAAVFFLRPRLTQKQLYVLADVREGSSPVKEMTEYIVGTP